MKTGIKGGLFFLGCVVSLGTWAQKSVQIILPPELQESGTTLQLKNIRTGSATLVDIQNGGFLNELTLRNLRERGADLSQTQISLPRRRASVRPALRAGPTDPLELNRSLVFDRPHWTVTSFQVQVDRDKWVLTLAAPPRPATPTAYDAARRRPLRENSEMRGDFETGWEHLAKKRADLALEYFDKILKQSTLGPAQRAQAHLGRGVSLFHQKGCGTVRNDFQAANLDPANRDDTAYFNALCWVEQKKFTPAKQNFSNLIKQQNSKYSEASRFYLGVVAESENHLDEAESAYLDTIDFANDASLVTLARERLQRLREQRRAGASGAGNRWVSFMFSGGLGYDTNVVALPRELSPESVRLKSQRSLTSLALGLVDVNLPFHRNYDTHLRYSFLALHYFSNEIARGSDIQAHDINASVAFALDEANKLQWTLGYSSILLGTIKVSEQYLSTPSLEAKWTQQHAEEKEKPYAFSDHGFKYAFVDGKKEVARAAEDITAHSLLYTYRYSYLLESPHVFGPGAEAELHPAKGDDISYLTATLLGHWTFPIVPQWKLSLSQEAAAQYTVYYQHSVDRKDWTLRYRASVVRPWGQHFETRVQFTGLMNLSNVEASYRYDKATLGVLASALF